MSTTKPTKNGNDGIDVYELTTKGTRKRLRFTIIDGEPWVNGLWKPKGFHSLIALTDGAIGFAGRGKKAQAYVKLSWLAEVFPEKAEEFDKIRRRIFLLYEACERGNGHAVFNPKEQAP